jgi:alpha-tubulin suppressor-like RCC1 family protein
VACGAAHCAVVAGGAIYTWGENDHGQLGHGNRTMLKHRRRVLFPHESEARGVACGRSHTLTLVADGRLFAWGSDACGQLGVGLTAFTPADVGERVSIHGETVMVGGVARPVQWVRSTPADLDGAIVLSVEDRLGGKVVLGRSGRSGATPPAGDVTLENPEVDGVRDVMRRVLSPVVVRGPPGQDAAWAVMACGDEHSAAVTQSGAAYAWGCAEDGRLGIPLEGRGSATEAYVHAPHALSLSLACSQLDASDRRPAMVDCGERFTAFVREDGQLWACGANWEGQLAHDPDEHEDLVTPTQLLAGVDAGVDAISCGAEHMAAIDGLGRLWVWGAGFEHQPRIVQLGEAATRVAGSGGTASGGEGDNDESRAEARCALVACGSGMVLAVTDGGDAYTWGKGANGCLGLGDHGQDHESPQALRALSTPNVHVQMVASSKSSASTEEGTLVLALAVPETAEDLSAQFNRFLLADAPLVT